MTLAQGIVLSFYATMWLSAAVGVLVVAWRVFVFVSARDEQIKALQAEAETLRAEVEALRTDLERQPAPTTTTQAIRPGVN